MEDSIIIYDVKTDDTLAKIGQKLGMSEDEVRDFHNINCEQHGLMYFNSLIGVEKIILPNNFKSPEQIKKENKEAVPSKVFTPNFFANNYQVVESYESDFENKVEFSYLLNIEFNEKMKSEKKEWVADIKNLNFKKNGEKPDDKISELSIACAESIAPLHFVIENEGKISNVYEIEKLPIIFEEKRTELEDYFIGEVATKYLDQFANNLSDASYFEKQIDSTFLYQVVFLNRSLFHKEKDWKENFYLVKNSFPLNCVFNVEFHHLNEEEIQTVVRGEVIENVSLQELLSKKKTDEEVGESMTGLVKIKYTTHKTSKQLLKVEAGIALIHDGEIYRKHKITVSKI